MWLEEEPTERKPEWRDREQKRSAAETPRYTLYLSTALL